jgi:hypothetical protein
MYHLGQPRRRYCESGTILRVVQDSNASEDRTTMSGSTSGLQGLKSDIMVSSCIMLTGCFVLVTRDLIWKTVKLLHVPLVGNPLSEQVHEICSV